MTSPEPSDTLLAQLLTDLERNEESALARIRSMDPALAKRLLTLIECLRDAGLLQEEIRLGHFHLREQLGHGSMGVVWRARDIKLDREVAVKVLAGHLLARREALERFQREARVIAALRHPGIVTVYEVGEDRGLPFIVLELVDGGSLAQFLERQGDQPLDADRACRIGVVLAEALQAAHEVGIVHRDVKPSNILLRSSGAPLLADFGLACIEGDPSLTATGDMLGTPAFAAPEMIESGRSDGRSDVYSLAATLFFALTGRPPVEGDSVNGILRHLVMEEAPRLRSIRKDLSIDLESVLGKALERAPARRYRTAREFAEDLGRVLRAEPVRARPVGNLQRVLRWCRRRPAMTAAILVPASLTLLFLLSFLWWQSLQLDRYEQLADVRLLANLRSEAPTLWPALARNSPRMESWLERAHAILQREDSHRRQRARLAGLAVGSQDGELVFPDEGTAWQYDVLTTLCRSIEAFRPIVPIIEARAHCAATVEEQTVYGPEARELWANARASIRASALYRGLEIHPQLGLLPLGEDPHSHLWELGLLHTPDASVEVDPATAEVDHGDERGDPGHAEGAVNDQLDLVVDPFDGPGGGASVTEEA